MPKFGDIVKVEGPSFAFERNYSICIYPNRNEKYDQCYIGDFFDIANINLSGILCSSCGNAPVGRLHIIPASESEKQELFNKLAEVGKRWNPETKQIEDIRWTPQQNEEYWFINGGLNVRWTRYTKFEENDIRRVKSNNCFKTEEASQKVAEQIKEIFKNSKAE